MGTVPPTNPDVLKNASKGGSDLTTQRTHSTIAYAGSPENKIEPVSARQADYYRNGAAGVAAREIQPFEFEGPASIRVYGTKDKGKEGDFIAPYTKFILNGVQEGHQERAQIVETFSDFYVFFYGEKPPIYSYTGTLINSKNVRWVDDFLYYYENYMRGTRCVENDARLIMTYGGRQVEGFLLNFSMQTAAETEAGVPVSFQLIITKRNQLGYSNDFGVFLGNSKQLAEAKATEDLLKAIAKNTGEGSSKPATDQSLNAVKGVAENTLAAAGPIV